ncbi:MAG: sulfate adenylyltransferase [Vulcanimicrobiaceae bacterium]
MNGELLVDRYLADAAAVDAVREARELSKITLSTRQLCDLTLIANGAFSPLDGFMRSDDYVHVVSRLRLADDSLWSLPITLAVDANDAPTASSRVALVDDSGVVRALMDVDETFRYDKRHEARNVYGTDDAAHPGVAAVYAQGDVLVGGRVHVLPQPRDPFELTPRTARRTFAERGWQTVVGFQTRNPVHRAHEYIQKCALEIVDGLFLHPLVGQTKGDDVPADVRLACYQTLLENYYPRDRVVLATLPASMRYAGPREALVHALIRKNFGCTHFIVGRDHAGVGNYYGTYAAQELLAQFAPSELGITPLKFENSFFCKRCGSMASNKTCPHSEADRVSLSGSKVRAMLGDGELPPPEFSRPEVASLLVAAYAR